jgi:ADP-ribose pyrophosphatase YjhB (NUDIX family)
MRVKARAVVVRDGCVLISRERRRAIEHLLLPGGRVQDGESITDALVREVREETGLEVVPTQLLYIAEVVGAYGAHDLNLIWLAELADQEAEISDDVLIPFDDEQAASIMPPIVDQIAADAADGWQRPPRWLGNVRRSLLRS